MLQILKCQACAEAVCLSVCQESPAFLCPVSLSCSSSFAAVFLHVQGGQQILLIVALCLVSDLWHSEIEWGQGFSEGSRMDLGGLEVLFWQGRIAACVPVMNVLEKKNYTKHHKTCFIPVLYFTKWLYNTCFSFCLIIQGKKTHASLCQTQSNVVYPKASSNQCLFWLKLNLSPVNLR